jgi:voltage-gated potassium channel
VNVIAEVFATEMKKPTPLKDLGPFQLVILTLSLFVLGLLAVELVFDLPAEAVRVLRWIDNLVCGLFFIDFLIRFHRAESKLRFMKWGWIDLLASIPAIDALRWGRLFRVFRILRMLRAVQSLRLVFEIFLTRNRMRGGVASVFTITFLVLSLASAGVLMVEHAPNSNITTAEDAVWWSVTTVTTVGYGDRYPVTLGGRLIAAVLMFTGVGLFGTLSGVIASFFLGEKKKKDESAPAPVTNEELLARLDALQRDVAALREGTSSNPPCPTPPRADSQA